MRVVIDTNVFVSRFLSPSGEPARVFEQWESLTFEFVVSEPMLEEYRRALLYQRVAVRHGMPPAEVEELIDSIRQLALVVEPREAVAAIARDPSDNKVLECAVAGAAEFIVSGDAHLLELQEYQGIQILRPTAFLAVLHEEK